MSNDNGAFTPIGDISDFDDVVFDCCPYLTTLLSGSPIIQNGRIIGAVTHVMIGDPTRGYGIFIENMLAEAEKIK